MTRNKKGDGARKGRKGRRRGCARCGNMKYSSGKWCPCNGFRADGTPIKSGVNTTDATDDLTKYGECYKCGCSRHVDEVGDRICWCDECDSLDWESLWKPKWNRTLLDLTDEQDTRLKFSALQANVVKKQEELKAAIDSLTAFTNTLVIAAEGDSYLSKYDECRKCG